MTMVKSYELSHLLVYQSATYMLYTMVNPSHLQLPGSIANFAAILPQQNTTPIWQPST